MKRGWMVAAGLLLVLVGSFVPTQVRAEVEAGQVAPQSSVPYGLWEERWVLPAPREIRSVIHDGNRYLAAAANGLFTSDDGQAWSLLPVSLNAPPERIAFGLGRYFVVTSNGLLMVSADAKAWEYPEMGVGATIREVAVSESRAVAVGSVSGGTTPKEMAWVSTDGKSWTPKEIGPRLVRVVYDQGRFVGLTEKEIYYSGDGLSWKAGQILTPSGQVLNDIAAGNGLLVAVGENGTILRSVDGGSSWTASTVTPVAHLHRVVYGDGRFVVTGRRSATVAEAGGTTGTVRVGALFTSTDGRNWQLQSKSDEALPNPASASGDPAQPNPAAGDPAQPYQGVEPIQVLAARKGEFLAAWDGADAGTTWLYRSPDGVRWESVPGQQPRTLLSLAYGNKSYLAVDSRGDLLTSPDGISWSRLPSSFGAFTTPPVLARGKDDFMLAGEKGLFRSKDGIAWTREPVVGEESFRTVTYSGGRYLAITASDRLAVATDSGWQWVLLPNGVHPRSIAYGSGRYVVVGDNGAMVASTDGVAWVKVNTQTEVSLHAIVWAKDRFVVAGGTPPEGAESKRSVILTSRDGKTWTAVWDAVGYLRSVAYTDGLYLAAGSNLMLSTDLKAWTFTGSISEIPQRLGESAAPLPPETAVYGDGEFIVIWGPRLLVRRLADPVRSTVRADKTKATNRDIVTLTVQVLDARGQPLAGRTVYLTNGRSKSNLSQKTDAAGRAVFQVLESRTGEFAYGAYVADENRYLNATVKVKYEAYVP